MILWGLVFRNRCPNFGSGFILVPGSSHGVWQKKSMVRVQLQPVIQVPGFVSSVQYQESGLGVWLRIVAWAQCPASVLQQQECGVRVWLQSFS